MVRMPPAVLSDSGVLISFFGHELGCRSCSAPRAEALVQQRQRDHCRRQKDGVIDGQISSAGARRGGHEEGFDRLRQSDR